MSDTTTAYVTGEWFDTCDPMPCFQGIVTGDWNGFATWLATRDVVERIIAITRGLENDLDTDRWDLDGDTLVITPWDEDIEITRIEPTTDGLYDVSLGYVWTTVDQWDEDTVFQPYDEQGTALAPRAAGDLA